MKRVVVLLFAASTACAGVIPTEFSPLGVGGSVGTPIPAVAWYKLDGNALDSSGNGYNGTWTGGARYSTGRFSGTQAAQFVGTNVVTVAQNLGVTTALTMSGWVNATNVAGFARLFGAEVVFMMFVYTISPVGRPSFYGSGLNTYFPSAPSVITGWHHVACVYDGDGVEGFVDGAPVGTLAKTGALSAQGVVPVTIGNRAALNNGFTGLIDDVRIFKRALSVANIKRIMESQDNEPIEELQ